MAQWAKIRARLNKRARLSKFEFVGDERNIPVRSWEYRTSADGHRMELVLVITDAGFDIELDESEGTPMTYQRDVGPNVEKG